MVKPRRIGGSCFSKSNRTTGFVDCPVEAITVKEIVEATEIQRIYMMFISPEEAYLNGMASREQFATLYKFILQQKK